MILPWITAAIILVALVVYAILGGADFGGGVWDLLASGPRARRQRELISEAIAPVWEANHIWLIVVIVLLFTCFPLAFSVISIALHVPLALMLLGIVMRAAAFVFRHYDVAGDPVQRRWGQIFAWSSIITPLFLGICVGAVSLGSIRIEDEVVLTGYFGPWLRPFPITVGVFTLALFAFLAAVYLTRETTDPELQEDFRDRGLMAQLWVAVLALLAAFANRADAAAAQLLRGVWPWIFLVLAVALVVAVTYALFRRRYKWLRVLAAADVATLVIGWGAAMVPYMVAPDLTIQEAAAPPHVHLLILVVLFVGAFILVPSLIWLYRIFKREPIFEPVERERVGP